MQFPKSIACILPRYAESLGGGAETLSRELLLALAKAAPATQIEVWTTCALDHRTWANDVPAGEVQDGQIRVLRFPVDPRDLEIFIRSEHAIQGGQHFTVEEQLAWLSESVNSSPLYAHIAAHGREFDVLLFAPYLFATSFWGSLIYPERSVVIPCLHDEPYAYLDVFKAQLTSVRGLLCNAEPERELIHRICGEQLPQERSAVVGMGFEPQPRYRERNRNSVQCKGIDIPKPYVLYSGRKELGKNVGYLLDCFEAVPRNFCRLVLIGSGSIDFRDSLPESVYDLGFVSEEEKLMLMANAVALCQPSLNESFSIVMMEAWQQGTACLVHGAGAVTRDHVVRANGGLYFENPSEFAAVVDYLVRHPAVAAELGEQGARYVAREYAWSAVLDRFAQAIQQFGLLEAPEEERRLRDGVH